MINTGMTVV